MLKHNRAADSKTDDFADFGADHTFSCADGEFHYLNWGGSGPLAHIAHANGFCAAVYAPFARLLSSRLRVVGMDDRGHGTTRAPADPRTLKNWDMYVRDQERMFEHLNEPVIAIGHSRGGVLSLFNTIRRPDLVRALVLIDPTILPPSWKWPWWAAKKTGLTRFVPIVSVAAKRRNSWPNRETVFASYQDKYPFKSWTQGFLEGYIRDGIRETENGTVALSCEPLWESRSFSSCPHDMWSLLPGLRTPTLVVYGSDSDTFLPEAQKRFEADVPSTTFKRLEKTSHFVPMERPDETVEAIFHFLEDKNIL